MYNKLPAIKTQINTNTDTEKEIDTNTETDTNKDIVEKSANISIKQLTQKQTQKKKQTKLQITKTTEESTERYLYAKRKITTSYLPMLDIRLKQRFEPPRPKGNKRRQKN